MRVADLMHKDVVTVEPDAAVRAVLVSLADAHVSAVPVVDEDGLMLGVVSSTDVIAAEAESEDEHARNELLENTPVRDIMTTPARTIDPEADIREAARQMLYADVHRLFVASQGQLVGVISTSDFVRAVARGMV